MDKQSKSRAATRENLLAAFWSLYQKKRIEKITVREITQLAGYNRGTFYDYFIDIYDVLDQFQDSLLDYTRVAIDKYRSDGINQEIVEYITNTFHTKGEYFSVFLGGNRDPNFPDKMKKVIRPIFTRFGGCMRTAKKLPIYLNLRFRR
ncbi:MAG: TetR/AcrR family transcriptional regulator [Clostridiales bacterium]|nr:TetR/AcrR family transcriptional regulator [Clostridiales bacterium]